MKLGQNVLYLNEHEAIELDTDPELELGMVLGVVMRTRIRRAAMHEQLEYHAKTGDTDNNPEILKRADYFGHVTKEMMTQPGVYEAAADMLVSQIEQHLSDDTGGVK